MSTVFSAFPEVQAIIQEGLLESRLLQALYPSLRYRNAFTQMSWQNKASSAYVTRKGDAEPNLTRFATRTDPTPMSITDEQFLVEIGPYFPYTGDFSGFESGLSIAADLMDQVNRAGRAGAKGLDRLARNKIFNAALAGQTLCSAAVNNSVTVPVQDINGFGIKWNGVSQFAAATVAAPQAVYFWTGAAFEKKFVVAVTPATAGLTYGPGTLTLSTQETYSTKTPIIAESASTILRSGGGYGIDDVGSTDYITIDDIMLAVSELEARNVPKFPDGTYHAFIGPKAKYQLFKDSTFELLERGRGAEGSLYGGFTISKVAGCTFYETSEAPNSSTIPTSTAGKGIWSAPLVNTTSVPIERTIICGDEFAYEYSKTVDAQNNGKNGTITNNVVAMPNGVTVNTDNLSLIIRWPVDRNQDVTSVNLKFEGDHVCSTDYLTGGAPASLLVPDGVTTPSAAYKRAVVIEHSGV